MAHGDLLPWWPSLSYFTASLGPHSFDAKHLASADYRVLKATDGAEALAISRAHADPIDLVMTDVNMPKTGGFVLGELLETLRPQTPVVYITGDPGVIESWRERQVGQHWSLLLKPFTPEVVLERVRQILLTEHVDAQG